jgi:rod shape-determining protein MreC
MFSKKTLMIVGITVLALINIVVLSVSSNRYASLGSGGIAIVLVAPFQKVVTHSIRFASEIWNHYFFLISVAKENATLKKALNRATEKNNALSEFEISNRRLRNLLNFRKTVPHMILSAEVIGRDPTPWFKTIIIDKGKADGIEKGFAVVVPEGIVGQVVHVSYHYSKVLLIIDSNSAVDALAQKIRARGVVKGEPTGLCLFDYVLRKHEIDVGDTVISSGLDGVYPKGLRIGHVSEVVKRNSDIFQEITVIPFVDFETLEEVLIITNPPNEDFESQQ